MGSKNSRHVVWLAAENGSLPAGKIGGMGDVVRELPPALAALGCRVTVVTPSYGRFHRLPGAVAGGRVDVDFAGERRHVTRYRVPSGIDGVSIEVLEHPLMTPRGSTAIYHDDPPERPFYTDATRFAFFSAAAAAMLAGGTDMPDVVHLHDWHLGFYAVLREFDPRLRRLRDVRTVFTIHNIALQGTRPLRETGSCLERWFPALDYDPSVVGDPAHADCINPMAAAIRLADGVGTVSPTYAAEILEPDAPEHGRHGGAGLERLLQDAAAGRCLVGILNGCTYPRAAGRKPGWTKSVRGAKETLERWIGADAEVASAHFLADRTLDRIAARRPGLVLTSVGRAVAQKLRLFREPVDNARSALECILDALGDAGLLVLLGSGDPDYEAFLTRIAGEHDNLLYLRGYSEPLADWLYRDGDLFLMPSSFEPCGISQMLAMRAGQPCVAHAVGGLKDSVDADCGFPFGGDTPAAQARAFVAAVGEARSLIESNPERWRAVRAAAAARRFEWSASAERYVRELYRV